MRHRVREFKAGRAPHQIKAMIPSQVCSLILNGRIKTTVVKAKETRRLAEKMLTLGKKGTLHDRRRAIAKLRNKVAVKQLFDNLAPQYMDREGGYTRIIRIGTRRGDAAEMCYLEWVDNFAVKKTKQKQENSEAETADAVDEEVVETEEIESTTEESVAEEPVKEKPKKKKAPKDKKTEK